MKLWHMIINWLMLIIGASIVSDIIGYGVVALTRNSQAWRGWLTHYFYGSIEVLGYLALAMVVLVGVKILLIAVSSTDKNTDESKED